MTDHHPSRQTTVIEAVFPSSRPGLTGRLVARDALALAHLDAMYHLLSDHFENVHRNTFEDDLAHKNWVILLEETMTGRLAGFSTLLGYQTLFSNRPVTIVYSGDTIVRRDAWGSAVLPRTWIASVNTLRRLYPPAPCYWLLITSGFRTYRFLPLFWQRFYPRYDAATPPEMRELIDHIAIERFGAAYDAITGVVRFPSPQPLRDDLRGIPLGRLADPHIAFFNSMNPGHERGEELVCLTELSADNLAAAGRRMVGEGI